ncbi:MAG TPA: hypothetical protein VF744_01140 [Beijerinckiaceae bacterium]|jgi:hypothetical protein
MASFVRHGHAYELYTYEPMDLPDGVRRRDAGEVLPRDRVFFYPNGPEQGSVAAFANLFRYKLLLSRGGWWVDADVVCLSEEAPEADLFLGWEDSDFIGSAILKMPPGHPLARGLYEESERVGTDVVWAQTGPRLMTRLVREAGLAPRPSGEAGYPIPWQDALALVCPERREEVRARTQGAPFLHLWNETFRRNCPAGLVAPPEGSYLAELFDAYRAALC